MRLFLTGATGQIGRRLITACLDRGDEVVALTRRLSKTRDLFGPDLPRLTFVEGDVAREGAWQRSVSGCDAVVHLAGAGIADHRWTARYRRTLVNSRVDGTARVVDAMRKARHRPGVFVSGSAVGYYGETGDEWVDESAGPGDDFLADLCRRWEAQAAFAEGLDIRTVRLRTGVVFDGAGGALSKMATPIRWFVGGRLGSGRQFMSWIHWRDQIGLILHAVDDERIRGPLNATAPEPARNIDVTRAIGRVLHRPTFLPAPALALRVALGGFASALLMSQRVRCRVATETDYRFRHPDLDAAVADLLTPPAPVAPAPPRPMRPTETVRLLVLDIDGTLVHSDGRLSPEVVAACRGAKRANCEVVLATARSPRSAAAYIEELALGGPTIHFNGALIWDHARRGARHHVGLDPAIVREIITAARALGDDITIGVDIIDRWYADRVDLRFQDDGAPTIEPDEVGPVESFVTAPVSRLSIIGLPAHTNALLAMIRATYWRQRRVALFLEPTLIQIAHPLVDKGIAVQRIAAEMGITRGQVLAVGDGVNDKGLIEWAGFGVAVGNACDELKALADVVAPTNDEHGVAHVIRQYVTRKW